MENLVTNLLGIHFPIIQGGMGNISDPNLAAAISNAGGLGTIGVGTTSVEECDRKISTMMENTDRPCCVNIPVSVHPEVSRIVEMVIRKEVPVVSLSAGNPAKILPRLKEKDIKVICVSSTVKQAKKAADAGADAIVCEGYEAAGINSLNESTTMTLIPQVVNSVSVPVIAAGGIADGRGMAAAISLGASGVQMGTRFVATKEAMFHRNYKESILKATDESTIIIGRPANKIRRILKGNYADKLSEIEDGPIEMFMEKTGEEYHEIGAVEGDTDNGFVNSGQIAGLINDCPSVAELMETMVTEAKETLKGSIGIL
ncbi:NAD(P)H-dependent flavin oxidoreductase [Virgibacillus xinjiangensis]|uniref:Probable nitronate monooxygenase n=1 Tax=Virgibacillus xinjiangensis TaxID=393090 RepID=A0ABV7CSZ5_9BACI